MLTLLVDRGESVGLGEMEMVGMDFGRGNYGHHFDVDKVLSSLSEEQLFEKVVCGICRDFPIGAMQTDVSNPVLSFFPRSEDWKLTQL